MISQHNINFVNLALRFLLACIILTLVMMLFGNQILSFLLPLFKWEIGLLTPSFNILHFNVAQNSGEAVFMLKVSIGTLLIVGGQFVYPNEAGSASATTIAGYVWQLMVLFLAVLCIWPAKKPHEYLMRFLLSLPILLLALMLDTPLALIGAIWDIIYQTFDPNRFSILIEWNRFMMAGGRLMLGLVAAMLVVYLSSELSKALTK